MTRIKFWIVKTSLLCISSYLLYAGIMILFFDNQLSDKIDSFIKGIKNPFLEFCFSSIAVVLYLLMILIPSILFLFSITLEREKTPTEIEEEEREEKELKEEMKKKRQKEIDELPLLEITLSTNEKIIGQFEKNQECFEDVKTHSIYYKRFIVKIEKVEKQ